MNVLPIQVGPDGVLIPHGYLDHATEFDVAIVNGYVRVRPKANGAVAAEERPSEAPRYPWIGIGRTKDPTASQRVEEILEAEIDRRAGWTLDP